MKASFPRKEAIPGCEPAMEILRPESASSLNFLFRSGLIVLASGATPLGGQRRAWRFSNGL
jgi:hypothetical protein